jgi:ubiquinone/menaquinone biosynthesis C-methylase UbiE
MLITDYFNCEPRRVTKVGTSNVYDFSESGASMDFYNDQFSNSSTSGENPEILPEALSTVPIEMKTVVEFLQANLTQEAVVIELGGSKFQRRSGFPFYFFNNYLPLDISQSSMIAYAHKYGRDSIACNAEKLPFKDNSIDTIFTHTFLEHPMRPDRVVSEIHRVLRPGGYVVHCDAWHCRWWKRFGIYKVKPFASLNFHEKVIWMASAVSEFKLIRIPLIIMRRFIMLLYNLILPQKKLKYRKLQPNYDLHLYIDEDAASNIDPVDIALFYKNNGYTPMFEAGWFNLLKLQREFVHFQKKK